jgi:hypothetical protein
MRPLYLHWCLYVPEQTTNLIARQPETRCNVRLAKPLTRGTIHAVQNCKVNVILHGYGGFRL